MAKNASLFCWKPKQSELEGAKEVKTETATEKLNGILKRLQQQQTNAQQGQEQEQEQEHEHEQQHEQQQQLQLQSMRTLTSYDVNAEHHSVQENKTILQKDEQEQQQQQQEHKHSLVTYTRPLSDTCSEQSCELLGTPNKLPYMYEDKQNLNASRSSVNNENNAASTSMNASGFDGGIVKSSTPNSRLSTNSNETALSANSNVSTCNQQERKRATPKHQRPLTRYLPIFSPDLDLRLHIETAGHQIDLCPHVFIDAYSCRGYLHKLGATFHAWSRRWFVLDRQRTAFIYYSDKSERKPRGGAYFSTIDEVYLDHLNTSKSGRPHCTFIVKTKKRCFNLQAASDSAARIWIDAIITGAQGNLDY